MTSLLEIDALKTYFPVYKGAFFRKKIAEVKAVDGVDLSVGQGETLGLVGESGCGKSTLGRTILGLADLTAGNIKLNGQELKNLSKKAVFDLRAQFQMIFQDPYASLDPRMTVFDTLAEPLLVHKLVSKADLVNKVASLMEEVGLAARFMKKYPHEFSGGQRQRIAIARALALAPKLIIADEPVSALDVSIQSQILNLLADLTAKRGLSMIFISHDLSVVKYLCQRVAVMYLGRIVELGETQSVFENPQHPYTKALISAIPIPDPKAGRARQPMIIDGDPPSPMNIPPGCRFNPRCPVVFDKCYGTDPSLSAIENKPELSGRLVACHKVNL